MYRYEIIRVEIKGLITSRPTEDYREIIKKKQKKAGASNSSSPRQ